jgi:hypothetical protein
MEEEITLPVEYKNLWVIALCEKCIKIDGVTHYACEDQLEAILIGNYCIECTFYEPI